MASPKARYRTPVRIGEHDGGGEEGWVRACTDGRLGVAELVGDADDDTARQVDDALAAGADDESLEHGRSEEPAGEAEEDGGRGSILCDPANCPRCRWGSEEECEEGNGRPAPYALDEVDIEHVLLVGEVVRRVERVGEGGEEGVGGVEVGVMDDGGERAEADDGGDGDEGSYSKVRHRRGRCAGRRGRVQGRRAKAMWRPPTRNVRLYTLCYVIVLPLFMAIL